MCSFMTPTFLELGAARNTPPPRGALRRVEAGGVAESAGRGAAGAAVRSFGLRQVHGGGAGQGPSAPGTPGRTEAYGAGRRAALE